MSLVCSPRISPCFLVEFRRHRTISRLGTRVSTIPMSQILERSTISSPPSNLFRPPAQRLYCGMRSPSSSMEPNSPSSTIIFIKGLPQSTSEGTLRRAFAQFGEVSQVKIITNKKNKHPLSYAYVWFVSEECAQMAVQDMNGKFFDGRFIFVEMAKPGSCKTRKKEMPYQF